jgi:hypothetical protein
MTDTQTAFVLVPRDHDGGYAASALPPEMIEAGQAFLDNYADQPEADWYTRMIAVGLYRAMLSAAPKPPESEIGPVAWVSQGQLDAHRDPLDPDHAGGDYLPVRVTEDGKFTSPLYPQARIDADAAIIAALRVEVAALTREVDARGERLDSVETRSKLDQAIIGRLSVEVTELGHEAHSLRTKLEISERDKANWFAQYERQESRAEAAEARVKELEGRT